MHKTMWAIILILLALTIYAEDYTAEDKCYESHKYCDCTSECSKEEICMMSTTPDDFKDFCFKTEHKISTARENGKKGFCTKLLTRTIMPDGQTIDKIRFKEVPTSYCEIKTKENITKNVTENITLPQSSVSPLFSDEVNVIADEFKPRKVSQLLQFLLMSAITLLIILIALIKNYKLKKQIKELSVKSKRFDEIQKNWKYWR